MNIIASLREKGIITQATQYIFILALTRQFFLWIPNIYMSWSIATISSIMLLFLKNRYIGNITIPRSKYIYIVYILFLVYYLLRAFMPDFSFDVVSFRLFASERYLRGQLFRPYDFFPILPVNPMPEIITGIFRWMLGYRLGTIINLFVVILSSNYVYLIISRFINKEIVKVIIIVLVFGCEDIFFEINNYLTDILPIPLLIAAIYTLIQIIDSSKKVSVPIVIYLGLLMGSAIALKLTNVVVVVPIVLVILYLLYKQKGLRFLYWAGFLGFVILLPSLPYFIYLYFVTGNPVFPFYNKIFKSPYFDTTYNFKDPRWGPHGIWESLIWPFKIIFNPSRISELSVYSGRLTLGFIVSIALLLLYKKIKREMLILSFITLIASIMWSFTTGYMRYGVAIELLGGILVAYLLIFLWKEYDQKKELFTSFLFFLVAEMLLVQSGMAFYYSYKTEWSLRPTIFHNKNINYDIRMLLRDRKLAGFISPDVRNTISQANLFVLTDNKITGIEEMLNHDIPTINLLWYRGSAAAKSKLEESLRKFENKKMVALIYPDNYENANKLINDAGLHITNSRMIQVPYYSYHDTVLSLLLVEITTNKHDAKVPVLSDQAYSVKISFTQNNDVYMKVGTTAKLYFEITNASDETWRTSQNLYLGNHWIGNGNNDNYNDGRAALWHNLYPGNTEVIPITITAPKKSGEYTLQFDMLQEGQTWFASKGSKVLNIKAHIID